MTKFNRLAKLVHSTLGHAQLPLKAKESQRLLRLLNNEFKKQLDEKHPPLSPASASSSSDPRDSPSGPDVTQTPYDTAALHLGSILTNPLLAHSRYYPTETKRTTDGFDAGAWWKQMVATGAADINAAIQYLHYVLKAESAHGPYLRRNALKEKHAGWNVWTWMKASGINPLAAIAAHPALRSRLVHALVAEEHENLLVDVMRAAFSKHDYITDYVEVLGRITTNIVHAHMRLAATPEVLVDSYLQCWEIGRIADDSHWFLHPRLRVLMQILRKDHGLGVQKYDAITNNWGTDSLILRALISLYHPAKPTARALLLQLEEHTEIDLHERDHFHPSFKRIPGVACVDAAELLIAQGHTEKADWVLEKVKRSRGGVDYPRTVLDLLETMQA